MVIRRLLLLAALLGCAPAAPDPALADGDGDGVAVGDCDDADAAVFPGASESCNGVDDDCNGLVDDGALDARTAWVDGDGDGFGDSASPLQVCTLEQGQSLDSGDCDDENPAIHTGAGELCDVEDVDEDCDGLIDAGDPDASVVDGWVDADGDGFGADAASACFEDLAMYAGDCDDLDPSVSPGAEESCNEADDDCDGLTDEDVASVWYVDTDGDGFGDAELARHACAAPAGFVATADDCAPLDAQIHPGADERCDVGGVDEDCDGLANDDDAGVVDGLTWYADQDGDGFGDVADSLTACVVPAAFVDDDTDCDDANAAVNPEAVEQCDGVVDENCDGAVDEDGADGAVAGWLDGDGDGYGVGPAVTVCDSTGLVLVDGDCDDGDPLAAPWLTDACEDGTDADCDGIDPRCGVLAGSHRLSASAALELLGESGERVGWSVRFVGDRSGDGLPELLVSSTGYTTGVSAEAGLWLTWAGPSGSQPVAWADAAMTTTAGQTLVIGGDIDCLGDGGPETLLGTPRYGGGGVFVPTEVYSASLAAASSPKSGTGSYFDGEASGDRAGSALAVGDATGDGADDALVGAPGSDAAASLAGAAYLVVDTFVNDSDLVDAFVVLEGDAAYDGAGTAVALVDVDGDGLDDLVVGAPGMDAGGAEGGGIALFASPLLTDHALADADATWLGAAGEEAGWRLAAGGDLDSDGHDDVLVGGVGARGEGMAWLLLSPETGGALSAASEVLGGEEDGDLAGAGLWGGDDLDGDGIPDVLIGAPYNDRGGVDAGTVYLLPGPWGAGVHSLPTAGAFLVGTEGSHAGWSVDAGGDTDADGVVDILVGAPSADLDGDDAGAVWLLLGGP